MPFCRRRCYYCDFPIKVRHPITPHTTELAFAGNENRACRNPSDHANAGTQVVGDRASTADAESERYVEVLLRELRATAASVEADSPLHPSNIRVCLLSMHTSTPWPYKSRVDRLTRRLLGLWVHGQAAGGLTSIFFGGGTPSLTPPHLIQKAGPPFEHDLI
jgi:hypothetical protein